MSGFDRRALLLSGGALALGTLGLLAARPAMEGGMHDPYFAGVSAALKRAGLMRPVLVIDRARLGANIAAIRKSVDAAGLPLRVVAKSLPSPALLGEVMAHCQGNQSKAAEILGINRATLRKKLSQYGLL